eukprot:TRINITY_DN3779_c0_g1_i3.p1 TRINITY_DN3779_c0_g1~~TRINITY_DN3779_c0_g1_i3.p1  ORF type:complete len:313 (+),score=131.30 TRINITY_DN3779_c0_g1_i3:169-1107(+)
MGFKVTVCGAAGGIGQPLSLLLKERLPAGTTLALYDIVNIPGVYADLSHINTAVKLTQHQGDAQLDDALKGADVVVIPAGVPRKPGMTRDDLFNINAKIVRTLVEGIARNSPKALIAIITNPVNSTVPIASAVLKKAGVHDPHRVFGVTTLDSTRANTFVAEAKGLDVQTLEVKVIGGHSGETILPLLSQVPGATFTPEEHKQLTHRIQNAGTEVVEAKAGAGSATLSMAHAGAKFTLALLRGLAGEPNVVECTFIEHEGFITPFFAVPVVLGKNGVEKVLPIGTLNEAEAASLENMKKELAANIEKGLHFQ